MRVGGPEERPDLTSFWRDLGFRESPYGTDPIPPTAEGDHLLVGRERELTWLIRQLTSSALHPTIEGENGVGKTSLVSVAGYRLQNAFARGQASQAYIPLSRTFQLTATDTADTLMRKVSFEIAQAFIHNHGFLSDNGFQVPDVDEINRWLNSPLFSVNAGGITVLGSGGTLSRGTNPNTSAGFSEDGFAALIDRWLRECFPTRQAGGFICVIDNVELLETSQAARSLLESMRDTVLSQRGLRWVLCGARGIIRTGASSQRLEGRLSQPLELLPISNGDVPEVVARRIEVYQVADGAVAPVGPEGFRHLYDVLNRNLRNALKFCEDFSFWMVDENPSTTSPSDNRALLEVWLTETADQYAAETRIRSRAWEVFDTIGEMGGNCSPSDYDLFGFKTARAMRPHVKALEDTNLVQSTLDDYDKRRKTITMTPRGWLVRYARNGYILPRPQGSERLS